MFLSLMLAAFAYEITYDTNKYSSLELEQQLMYLATTLDDDFTTEKARIFLKKMADLESLGSPVEVIYIKVTGASEDGGVTILFPDIITIGYQGMVDNIDGTKRVTVSYDTYYRDGGDYLAAPSYKVSPKSW